MEKRLNTSISNISRNLTGKTQQMSDSDKTVSQQEMEAEWKIIQSAQKNPALFRPIYEKYYLPIFKFIMKRVGDQSLSADISSQVFLKAMQKLHTYTFQGVPFSAWLYRIASNEVAQHYRKTQKTRVVSVQDYHVNDMIQEVSDIDDFEAKKQLMLQLLSDLKESDLKLVELRFFEQRSYKEIADILEITESNAKVKTYRIVERMKKKAKKTNL